MSEINVIHWRSGRVKQIQTRARVEFTLSVLGGKTLVSLAHTGFAVGEAGIQVRETHAGVRNIYLENLKSFIENGKD